MTDEQEVRKAFWTRPAAAVFSCWGVYDHPTDYPDHVVIRRHDTVRIDDHHEVLAGPALGYKSLDEARGTVPPGKTKFVRNREDPPDLVESYV